MSILDDNTSIQPDSGLKPTGEMKRNWIITSKWAMFFAILGFIYIGFALLTIGAMGTMLQTMGTLMGENPATGLFVAIAPYMTIMTLFSVALLFFINYFHLQFALKIKQALNVNDQGAFVAAWKNLRNHFRIFGIMVCVMIGLYLIVFIAGLSMLGAASTGSY